MGLKLKTQDQGLDAQLSQPGIPENFLIKKKKKTKDLEQRLTDEHAKFIIFWGKDL